MSGIVIAIISFITPCVNLTVMLLALPRRWKLGRTLLAFAAVLLFIKFPVTMTLEHFGITGTARNLLTGLTHLPFLLFLFRGQFFQKIFAYFMQMVLSAFQLRLVDGIAWIIFPSGDDNYYLFRLIFQLVMYAGYITLMYVHGKRFMEKLFVDNRAEVWALYSFGAVLSFVVTVTAAGIEQKAMYFLTLFFAVWSFGTLCFVIINTYEKAKKDYDLTLAHNALSAGLGHYQKMNELHGEIRALRHDYKFHLATANRLLRSGDTNEIETYLKSVEMRLADEKDIPVYCENPVVNALLADYAERCAENKIALTLEVVLPGEISIDNYELCVICGNILENAVEACMKIKTNRYIKFYLKPTDGGQLALLSQNSCGGDLAMTENGWPNSTKTNGGFGLRSIQAVASRHDGNLNCTYVNGEFSTYLLMRLG